MSGSSPPAPPQDVWVIDTSSIILVFRDRPKPEQDKAAALLTKLAHAGQLVFPPQVIEELKRYAPAKKLGPHPPLQWALSVESVASSAPDWNTVKNDVLTKVSDVLDSEKPATVDEADPYVLARALELQRAGRTVRVITEETRKRPGKLALSTAAGVLGLAAVTLPAFLKTQGL
jgi:predicted nucleic acid-binding protein